MRTMAAVLSMLLVGCQPIVDGLIMSPGQRCQAARIEFDAIVDELPDGADLWQYQALLIAACAEYIVG
jgi:hypothetical protein